MVQRGRARDSQLNFSFVVAHKQCKQLNRWCSCCTRFGCALQARARPSTPVIRKSKGCQISNDLPLCVKFCVRTNLLFAWHGGWGLCVYASHKVLRRRKRDRLVKVSTAEIACACVDPAPIGKCQTRPEIIFKTLLCVMKQMKMLNKNV